MGPRAADRVYVLAIEDGQGKAEVHRAVVGAVETTKR